MEFRRGRIDYFDLIGFGEKGLGDALRSALAADALDGRLLFCDMLQIDRGDDGNTAIKQLIDVLAALGIPASRRIVKTPSRQSGRSWDDGGRRRQINHLVTPPVMHPAGGGNDLEFLQDFRDILAALFAAQAFVQHALRLANPGGVTQKHLSCPRRSRRSSA